MFFYLVLGLINSADRAGNGWMDGRSDCLIPCLLITVNYLVNSYPFSLHHEHRCMEVHVPTKASILSGKEASRQGKHTGKE